MTFNWHQLEQIRNSSLLGIVGCGFLLYSSVCITFYINEQIRNSCLWMNFWFCFSYLVVCVFKFYICWWWDEIISLKLSYDILFSIFCHEILENVMQFARFWSWLLVSLLLCRNYNSKPSWDSHACVPMICWKLLIVDIGSAHTFICLCSLPKVVNNDCYLV